MKQSENIYELNNPIFKDVIAASLDAIICADQDGNIILWNPAAEKMFGYGCDEVMGKPLTILMQPSVQAEHLAGFKRLIKSGKMGVSGRIIRTEGIKKDGTVFTHDMSLAAEVIDGRWVIVGILRDMTESIQLQEALKSHAYFLNESEKIASLGTFKFDLKSGQWTSSNVLNLIFGIDDSFQRDIDGWLKIVHPEMRKEMQQHLTEDVLTGHHPFDRQYRIIRQSDQAERWLHGRGDLVFDADGKPVSLVGTVQDITSKKLAENKLRQLSRSVEQAGESILITNREGIIEYVNPAFTELTGYTFNEAVGRSPVILNSGKQDKAFYKELWDTILSGKVWRGSVVDRKKCGELYPSMLVISPSINDEGEITHFIGIQNDLTEYRTLEDQFHQAQKMEAIGTLVGGIAHDFNNVLAGITGNLYLLKNKLEKQPELIKKLTTVEQLCFRAADMISQLLTFSRKGKVEVQKLSLTAFIKEVLKMISVGIPENIKFTRNICSGELIIQGDATQLQQVVLNLVNNAHDALADRAKAEIKVSLALYTPESAFKRKHNDVDMAQQYAHLSVKDNGIGMSHADKMRIFEPFFTTKEQGKGTGLGLAMVFGSVEMHHGIIEVVSKPGKGSCFHIYLPIEEQPRTDFHVEQAEAIVSGTGETILLADDEAQVRETMADVLENLGYQVLLASNGVEALSTFRKHQDHIALTILDMVMPEMGGKEAAMKIRDLNASTPILFATGYDKLGALGEKVEIPFSQSVGKPTAIDELSRVIYSLIHPNGD